MNKEDISPVTKYIVVVEDHHGQDMVDDVFDTLQEAKNRFDEHKAERSYYCRYESAEMTLLPDGEEEWDNNETIESYYPEDDEEDED